MRPPRCATRSRAATRGGSSTGSRSASRSAARGRDIHLRRARPPRCPVPGRQQQPAHRRPIAARSLDRAGLQRRAGDSAAVSRRLPHHRPGARSRCPPTRAPIRPPTPTTVEAPAPAHGQVVAGSLRARTRFHGLDEFTYRVADRVTGSARTSRRSACWSTRNACADIARTVEPGQPFALTEFPPCRDPDGDPLAVSTATPPHGTLVRDGDNGRASYGPRPASPAGHVAYRAVDASAWRGDRHDNVAVTGPAGARRPPGRCRRTRPDPLRIGGARAARRFRSGVAAPARRPRRLHPRRRRRRPDRARLRFTPTASEAGIGARRGDARTGHRPPAEGGPARGGTG